MNPKRFLPPRYLVGAAIASAALATGLSAGSAAALTFNFSFNGDGSPDSPASVTGTISGLVDNLASQTTGLTVTINSATNNPPGLWPVFTSVDYLDGDGISVASGAVTNSNIFFLFSNSNTDYVLQLNYLGNTTLGYINYDTFESASNGGEDIFSGVSTLQFTSTTPPSVPGPLPVFGAVSAFGFSRRLRRRLSQCRGVARQAGAITG